MTLDDLQKIVDDRKRNPRQGSYVSSLIAAGRDEILRKIGEESAEVILSSKNSDRRQVIHEVADLWFHCVVLLTYEGVLCSEIMKELDTRHLQKG